MLNLVKIIKYTVDENIIGAPKIKRRGKKFAITNLHSHYEIKYYFEFLGAPIIFSSNVHSIHNIKCKSVNFHFANEILLIMKFCNSFIVSNNLHD